MGKTIKATFKKERECKHSTRYVPVDEIGESISAVIYVSKVALTELGNPKAVTVTVEAKDG